MAGPWAALAASAATVSFILPPTVFRNALRRKDLRFREVALPQGFDTGYRNPPPSAREVEDPALAMRYAATADQTALILTLAMRESVAVMGLVLAVLGFPLEITAAFCAVAVVLMALRFPSESSLRRRAEAALDARIPG